MAVKASGRALPAAIFGSVSALPRGPHRLPRQEVAASQRTRLLAAVVDLVADKGYGAATITEIARRAGVSPNVFYEHFRDKEACYLAAYDVFAQTLLTRMLAEVPETAEWNEFVTSTLDAYLGTLEADLKVARAFLLEMDGAGPRARRRRREAYAAMAAVLAQRHALIRRRDPNLGPLPERVYFGFVHGVRELVCDALESRPRIPLTDLGPDVLRWITATVQGAAAAEGDLSAPT